MQHSQPAGKIDRYFLLSVGILTVSGFIIFLSASLGLLAQGGASFASLAVNQTIGLLIGLVLFFVMSKLPYMKLRKWAWVILLGSVLINLLLFIPSLASHVNGASRWIKLGPITFQPSELLKVAVIIYVSAWAYMARERIKTFKFGLLPYVCIAGILGLLLVAQRDTDTLLIIACTGLVMFLIAGMPWKHASIAVGLMIALVIGIIIVRPYALQRVKTYLNRNADAQGSGYQINQSLIAIGSGRWTGRGFGQSIQKFGYLPQPTDDSIFAVAAEEFGFIGGLGLLAMYVFFAIRTFIIGSRCQDIFGGLMATGFGILIIMESFMNMGAMLGLIPLSGVPLLFVSHGGSALIIVLMTAGILANISRYAKS